MTRLKAGDIVYKAIPSVRCFRVEAVLHNKHLTYVRIGDQWVNSFLVYRSLFSAIDCRRAILEEELLSKS